MSRRVTKNKPIDLENLPSQLAKALEAWGDEVGIEAYELLDECANDMLEEIKQTNVMKKGWKLRKLGQRKTQSRWERQAVNAEHPWLVHIHEFGYVTKYGRGGQDPANWPDPRHTKERVEARPSVLPAYYRAVDRLHKGLNKIIGKG